MSKSFERRSGNFVMFSTLTRATYPKLALKHAITSTNRLQPAEEV